LVRGMHRKCGIDFHSGDKPMCGVQLENHKGDGI
jgi:hypothetical protein